MATLTLTIACTKRLLKKLQSNVTRARMNFKPKKSRSISIIKDKLIDHRFLIDRIAIPMVSELSVKSLGWWYSASLTNLDQSNLLRAETINGLGRIDKTLLPGKLKLWCLQFGLMLRLMWPLMLYEITITKVEKLERQISSYIDKCLRIPCCLSNIGLYVNNALQLHVSSLTEEYNCHKVRLNMILTESQDAMIWAEAEVPRLATGRKWTPSTAVQESKTCSQASRHCKPGVALEKWVWTLDRLTYVAQGNICPERKAGGSWGLETRGGWALHKGGLTGQAGPVDKLGKLGTLKTHLDGSLQDGRRKT